MTTPAYFWHQLLRRLAIGPIHRIGRIDPFHAPCAVCGTEGQHVVCADCYQQYLISREARCDCCALPLSPSTLPDQIATTNSPSRCGTCIKDPPNFDRSVTATTYAAPCDQLILSLKFRHQLAVAPVLANALRDAVLRQTHLQLPDLMTIVPLGSRRLVARGFNQSLEIAKPFAAHLGIHLLPQLLQRTRETVPQSSLHPDQRQKNIRQAFAINFEFSTELHGKHIGVIDDVMTTGATFNEIAGILKDFGAVKVTNFMVARTARH
jgi:ComF family protein